jgi:hypothetical protein
VPSFCSAAKSVDIINCTADLWATSFLESQEIEIEGKHLITQELDFASTTIVAAIEGGYIAAAETQSHAVDCGDGIGFTSQRDLLNWQVRRANIKVLSMKARQTWIT